MQTINPPTRAPLPLRTTRPSGALPPRRRGFTLLELMVIIAVMGAAVLVIIPKLGNTSSTRLRAAAQMLVADIEYAQAQSIANPEDPRVVVFDKPNNRYYIAAKSTPTTPLTRSTDRLPYVVQFGTSSAAAAAGVTLSSVTVAANNRFGFGSYGQLDQGTAVTVVLAAGGNTVTLTIDPVTGQATVSAIQ